MDSRQLAAIRTFVERNIDTFHEKRLERIKGIKLDDVLTKKNPYLFKAKALEEASALVISVLEAFLSSSEEEMFGHFLEDLAIFTARDLFGGAKSSAEGVDLEFERGGIRYLVTIKSGPNWGNSDQWAKLNDRMATALQRIRQSKYAGEAKAILGICYGRRTSRTVKVYEVLTGQAFWSFLSGDESFYLDIVEPIGSRAKEHNDTYETERAKLINRFTREFIFGFCDESGAIDWSKLVQFSSARKRPPRSRASS